MQENEGRLLFEVRADQTDIKKDIEAIKKQFESLTEKTKEEGKKQAEVWQNLVKGATAYFTLQGASAFIKQVVAVRSQFQQLEISFGTMLKSKEKANDLMAQMADLAAKTPFGLEEVSEGAKRLLAFQVPAEEVTETLRRMGDVAAGLGVPMERLIHVYGQVKAQGRMFTNDLYQFMNAGIPMISELSKAVGKSETEIKEMVSEGKIGFAEVQAVIKNMTNEGGTFYNLMDAQSKSLGGQISNLKDSFAQVLNEIGKATEGIASGAISSVSFLVENYKTLGKVIAGLIVTYGAYRTAVLVNIALTKGWAVAAKEDAIAKGIQTAATKAQTIATAALNTVMKANPYVLVATAVVGLGMALWALKSSTDANAEATERHNQLREEQANKIDKEKNRINKLIGVIQDETKSWNERNKAFLELQNTTDGVLDKYSSLNQVLREMSQVLKDLNGRYETMNDNLSREAVTNTEKSIQAKEAEIKRLEKLQEKVDSTASVGIQQSIDRLKKQIESDKLLMGKQKKVVVKLDVNNYENILSSKNLADIQAEKKLINEAYNIKKKEREGLAKFSYNKVDSNNPYLKFSWEELGMYNQATERQIKLKQQENEKTTDTKKLYNDILELQKKISAQKNANRNSIVSEKSEKELSENENTLKGYIDRYKSLTGIDLTERNSSKKSTKTKTKTELPTFDYEKDKRDKDRLEKDRMFEEDEAKIKAMKDGTEKRNALLVFEYEKRAETIKRKGEDELQAFIETEKQKAEAAGKWKKGEDFNTDTEAIHKEEARIAKNQEILNQDNLDEYTRQQEAMYKQLLEKYQTYTDQRKAIEEKYNTDIAAMQAKLGADAPQVKKAQDEKARELKKLDILYKKEGTAIAKLFENMRKKTVKEIRETIADAEKEIDQLASILDMSDKDNVDYVQNLRQQLEQAKDTADRSDTVFGRLGKNIQAIFKFKPNTIEWKEALQGVLSDAQSITGEFGQLGQEFEKLGQSTGNEALRRMGQTVQAVSNTLNRTLSMAQVGNSVGSGWGAAIGAVVGLVVSGFETQARAQLEHEKKLREIATSKIAQQNEYNRLLYEERMLMKNNKSIFGTKEIKTSLEYLKIYEEKWLDLQEELFGDANARSYHERQGLKNYNFYEEHKKRRFTPNEIKSSLDNIQVATGSHTKGALWWKKSVTDYSSITLAHSDLIKQNGEFNRSLAESLIKTKEFGEGGKEALQKIIDLYDQAQEAQKKFDEYLQNTFGDLGKSITDSVYNSLQKGEDAFESFAKTVGNVIGKLGKQLVYEIYVAESFKNLQEKIRKAADNNSGSKDFAEQSSRIVGEFGNTMKSKIGEMQQFLRDWNTMSSNIGFDFLDEQRKAVEKGFARMSQDSADELNGQFRLQTQLSAEIRNAALQTANFIREMHQYMQSNAAQQLRHLAGIEANTYKLNKMETDLAGVKRGIDELTTKGIKLKP
jgi:hypothetical protein